MLKKENRLPAQGLRAKKVFTTDDFTLKISENNLDRKRFGFVVSKKIDKRAIGRNKIKRIYRACIEKDLKEIKPGYDFLFIIRRMPDKEICSRIKETIKKVSK